MNDDRQRLLAATAKDRAAVVDSFFASAARGDAEAAYARMSSVFQMLFTLPAFRVHLEHDSTLAGYRRLDVLEERLDAQPSDLAILDLANFGDSTPSDNWEAERLFEEYLTCPHVIMRGVAELSGGRSARFQAAVLLERTGWRLKGYQLDELG
ncbi:MAG: hypothetical protein KatS3mg060_1526 [Dehalococcoidia bacterium]|nr:MAG: hypothetical protein KatS3mg060_1526 [Dehalococcoidia bacterium]